ncbi:response regulator transcription factor [Neolewinella aurantiaca]|uniref:Response regulator transcription factor n=1 Tax=Neolewinella aurantiaca TaxID=2602767 RepID=A0A5C7F8G5_9BACT|nr:response regulator transcription factor [Neolewinella aurantiaca]TXF86323.1 response regulator transcription factor [Neolewinella aurantiaca]
MINCLIIDDEPLAGQLLAAYAERSADLTVAGTFSNPIEALHFLSENKVDLLFLDIQMPELTGLQLMKITRDKYQIVLTTAYEEYALKSYDFQVTDYLLKPISLDRFLLAVEKVKKNMSSAAGAPPPAEERTYIFVKSGHKTVRIDYDSILRLESMSNYVVIHTAQEKIMTLENLSTLIEALPGDRFVRTHRSHAVALDKIDFIERNRAVIAGEHIPISDGYKDGFWEVVG